MAGESSKRGTVTDVAANTASGYVALIAVVALILGGIALLGWTFMVSRSLTFGAMMANVGYGFGAIVIGIFGASGIFVNEPNQSSVLTLFGKYVGTDSSPGLRWTNPFVHAHRVSRRTMVTETSHLKVNDSNGNPIEIAAAVAWHVDAPAKAALQVESYERFVKIQSEACVRAFASTHPYDEHDDPDAEKPEGAKEVLTLLGGGAQVADFLKAELTERLAVAGIDVEEARVTHLAYAPEIAPAMLRRQQAQAVIAAKRKIVQGAVGMVKDAVEGLKAQKIEIDTDRTAALVSNLLVVLVSDREATPVVNAGTVHG